VNTPESDLFDVWLHERQVSDLSRNRIRSHIKWDMKHSVQRNLGNSLSNIFVFVVGVAAAIVLIATYEQILHEHDVIDPFRLAVQVFQLHR